jgi:hypothetical protein
MSILSERLAEAALFADGIIFHNPASLPFAIRLLITEIGVRVHIVYGSLDVTRYVTWQEIEQARVNVLCLTIEGMLDELVLATKP